MCLRKGSIGNAKHKRIIERYQSGKATKEISEEFGITQRGVLYVLHRYGVEVEGRRRSNCYKVDEDFFKSWSNDMAYVLGFVFTDGNVSGNSLAISQKERYILEKINKAMKSDYKINERVNGKNPIYTLSIYRKELVDDLRKLGVTEGKSRIMEFPTIPNEYLPHFIRGVIDGDGWVQDRGYVMNITNASKKFSQGLHDIFNAEGLNGRITEQNNAYRVWVSGKQDVIKLAEWIYDGCGDLYLRRKRDRFFVNKNREQAS